MVLDHGAYIIQDLFGKGFTKLVPLAKDSHTPNVGTGGVIEIADDPKFWNPAKLADNYHKFHHVSTTFGPVVLPDGTIGYSHCLDIDSQSVRSIIEPYLPELMNLTYIVQTKKGLHIHWIESTQHERIGSVSAGRYVKRCIPEFEFELKTDHKGGLAHLPGSLHRDDIKEKNPNPFRYHRLEGCADKVGLLDDFMGSGLGFYDWLLQDTILGQHVREPGESKTTKGTARRPSKKRDARPSAEGSSPHEAEEQQQQQEDRNQSDQQDEAEDEEQAESITGKPIGITAQDIHFSAADRLYTLFEQWYVNSYRNEIMLSITGTIRRSWYNIALEDAELIIEKFCDIARDEEPQVRLTTLRTTYEAQDLTKVAGFGHLEDIIGTIDPDISEADKKAKVDHVRTGFYNALADFAANNILLRHPNLEISPAANRHIVILDNAIEEIEFPEQSSSVFKEMIRTSERKNLLLNAAPIPPINEIWDPLYQQTKYKMAWRSLGQNSKVITKEMDRPLTIDDLEEWIRINASYYHKPNRLSEVLHAMVDSCNKAGLVNHKVGTEIQGLVFLPTGPKQKLELVLSNMDRPAKPKRDQAQACIATVRDIKSKFYNSSSIETLRYAHFLKIGVVSPIDFARRQSGAVNRFKIIPRQDLGGWTDVGKTLGYAAIPLRMYRLPLEKSVGDAHSYIIGSGSIDSAARFIAQTGWTTFPVIFDEADRYSDWEQDREAKKILSLIKNSTMLTNPRDTLTSDSELTAKPSAAYILITHNSELIQEDGFNKRSTGHEFTTDDEKGKAQMDAYDNFWKDDRNANSFGYLGDYVINYYLDNPEVLNNTWHDISKTILRSFWVDAAGLTVQEFDKDWSDWLGKTVESATSKEGLIEDRTRNAVSMFRQMISDSWSRNRQPAATWIAVNCRGVMSSSESQDHDSSRFREIVDGITASATFAEKLEALVKMESLPFLAWNYNTNEIIIDSSIVSEMRNHYGVPRVTHKGLAALLKLEFNVVRFGGETKKVIHASIEDFVKRIAPPEVVQNLDGVI